MALMAQMHLQTSYTVNRVQKHYLVKATLNKWVFKSFLKLFILLLNRMIAGKLFHIFAAAIPKALLPHCVLVRFNFKSPCSDERRARRGVYD